MTEKEFKQLHKSASKNHPEFNITQSGYFYSPFISIHEPIKNHEYNASYFTIYKTDDKQTFVTVLSYYDSKFILKCSDPFLEGKLTQETLNKIIEANCQKIPNCERAKSKRILKSHFKTSPEYSNSCGFNQKNYETSSHVCKHIARFLYDLPEGVEDILYTKYHNGLSEEEQKLSKDSLEYKLKRYAFKKHVLLEGDKGSGKTYTAVNWAKKNKFESLFLGGHEQFESIDFLGHYIQSSSGKLSWKDGALSEAFRKAQQGQKVVLIIDEMLRIPKRELNILVSSLSATNEVYTLRTNRAIDSENGVAKEEVLHAPVENLWIIGTTNVGADYAVEEIDEALADRFKPLRKDVEESELREILNKTARVNDFTKEDVNRLMSFYAKMQRLYHTDIIKKIINIRHLNEALQIAQQSEEIEEILEDSILLWVERDYSGKPNMEQINAVKSALRRVYDES